MSLTGEPSRLHLQHRLQFTSSTKTQYQTHHMVTVREGQDTLDNKQAGKEGSSGQEQEGQEVSLISLIHSTRGTPKS